MEIGTQFASAASGTRKSIPAPAIWTTALWCLLHPAHVFAGGIDTEHIYGFMIGSDVGQAGEREFQTTSTGRFSRQAGKFQALDQQLEMEFVPFRNFRIEVGTTFAAYDIASGPGLLDRNQAGWQGATV